MEVKVKRIRVRDERAWSWWNHRMDLVGDIDPDITSRVELDAVVDGQDLGPVATEALLKQAGSCGCHNQSGDCVACEVESGVAAFRHGEALRAPGLLALAA